MKRPARVLITLRDGYPLQRKVGVNRGYDDLPYSRDELRTEFMALSGRGWSQHHAAQILDPTPAQVDDKIGFSNWVALLSHPPRQTC